jgi:putative N-acetyltransferase (TIGR04045 family)
VSSRFSGVVEPAAVISCALARPGEELEAHFALRRQVFVVEQGLFFEDDRDERDLEGSTLHAIGFVDAAPRGAVRLYPLTAPGLWKGDRLAVAHGHRSYRLGASLVEFAVATAGALSGERMIAHVQLPNVSFFEHLGWTPDGAPGEFHGVLHQLMSIGLRGPDA